ncbi:MAG: M28 family peptidase [Verrucomicrobiales bacterium]
MALLAAGWASGAEDAAEKEAALLGDVRQLTFEGRRAGEGYFSADGTKMVFQSEREEGNPFYQIYLMDLETGDIDRISPGMGKTTCAWIHPDGKKVLFASTHADPESENHQKAEFEERESGQARKYSWDYDAEFDIYEYNLESGEYVNLTDTEGYDAEGAYSPDGNKIVFASNRQAYDGSMSKEDQKFFKLDKKFAMEIYTANADGSNVQRLTDADGYDGGPFFSADGERICWRRFDRKGLTAEIHTMAADGSDQRQITDLGAMSWAPFFHPGGDYLIFATNKHGFENFELYLVDAAGEKEPVRVTHTDGFDGLPAFSPDGAKLSWTTNRTPSKQSQIFLANWDDGKARELLGLDVEAEKTSGTKAETRFETAAAIVEADMRAHVGYLASDELNGRLTGTEGEILATEHVAAYFEEWGLEPGGDDGSWFQEFEFTAGVAVGEDNALTLEIDGEGATPEVDEDWRPVSFSKTGDVRKAGVVFAGYGLEIPDEEGGDEYSSYFHLDVKGKWVMVLRYIPEGVPKEQRERMQRYARLRHKATLARRKFAAGIIFVTGPETEVKEELVPMQFDASLADSGIPAISITTKMAEDLVRQAGKDLGDIQKALDAGESVEGFEIPKASLAATIDVAQEKRRGRNAIGILSADQEGAHPNPAVVVGAHIDHLGGEAGPGSLARDDEKDEIHNGADDNASGVAGLLEIAEYLADQKSQGKLDLQRDLVFAAWSGEELGLLGSSHFVRSLAKNALGDENAPLSLLISSYLNMDMIGRLGEKLILQGVGSSEYWEGAIERRNAPVGLPITIQRDTYLPTDATNFYLRKVPILSAFTGAHEDYHTPRDTADKVDYGSAAKIARLVGLIARGLAIDANTPQYVKVDPPKNRGSRGFRVYLGTIPDYSQGDIEGVKLSGVAETGPAAKAGLKGGDVIVGLAGKKILNIYDYTEALAGLKVGEETDITILRGDEELKLELVPGSRD